MIVVFDVKDSTGRKIRLTEERWNHISDHPEMVNTVELLKETLEVPDTIVESPGDKKVHYYFKHYKIARKFLLVAVKYLNGDGFIITGFFTSKKVCYEQK